MSSAAKVGAFFLLGLLVVCALILRIQDIRIGSKKRTGRVEIHFKDVAGLDDQSAVRIAGVRVGKVDGVHLLPDGSALAILALDPDVELREGASGRIRSLGLLGDKYVEVLPGQVGSPKLAEGARLEGEVPIGFDELAKQASDIAGDVKKVTEAMSRSLGGPDGAIKIDRIVDNIGLLAQSLRDMVESNRGNVDMMLANLTAFSAELRETLARVDRLLDENRTGIHGTVGNVEEVTGKLKTTADNLNAITEKINSGEGTIGKLLNDDETHRNLNEALTSVKSGVDAVNTTLSRINKLQVDLGFSAEYISRGARSREMFTLDAIPRENKFYRLQVVSLPDGKRKNEQETTTTTLPDGTTATIRKETETFEDTFGISLLLGYRLKNTIVRAGIIESRGGLGVDQLFLQDRLQLTGDLWDFSAFRTGNPKMKIFSRWNATPNLYVQAGAEDVLNSNLRSLTIGAGIRWKDEDLKSLLGTASGFISP